MGTFSILGVIVALHFTSGVLGEPSYRQYRIHSGSTDPDYNTYYTNPYVNHPYRYRGSSSDDVVYVTDMYGRTTVQSSGYNRLTSGYSRALTPTYQTYTGCATCVCSSRTCGQNAQCQVIGGRPVCACLRGYTGDPLSLCKRAECIDHGDCRGHLACNNGKCVDPCAGSCGANANCETRNHVPVCSCPAGYTGDPFTSCRRFNPEELCHPSPCGPNTNCQVKNEVPTCTCLPGYHGSPITGCRHECESDSRVRPHGGVHRIQVQEPVRQPNYFGNPYSSCKPECYGDVDCPTHKPACFYGICKSPCEGACGVGANCELRGLTPVCSCPKDMTGDPFVHCRPFEPRDLCEPNPCGSNAHCEPGHDRSGKERPVCTCPFGYIGDPLKACFKGECTEGRPLRR
ncbi:hypothetical protein NQ318_011230 [Aromia moschata]|uniref:EGF-like domain-containing protein n=1 Tax=Aromia moschata TaxID=1265417 RepID=A0AAV8YI02_9CUCU|nr:hypothetical protein NQ318_011230 [Aromia moschata]